MSVEVSKRLICDGHQCDLAFPVGTEVPDERGVGPVVEARAHAAAQGWTVPERGRDLCPDCSATP